MATNPTQSITFIVRIFKHLIEAATLLAVDADLSEEWSAVRGVLRAAIDLYCGQAHLQACRINVVSRSCAEQSREESRGAGRHGL